VTPRQREDLALILYLAYAASGVVAVGIAAVVSGGVS
jgi:hypothetical protein